MKNNNSLGCISLIDGYMMDAIEQTILRKITKKSYCKTCIVGRENPDMCANCDRAKNEQGENL